MCPGRLVVVAWPALASVASLPASGPGSAVALPASPLIVWLSLPPSLEHVAAEATAGACTLSLPAVATSPAPAAAAWPLRLADRRRRRTVCGGPSLAPCRNSLSLRIACGPTNSAHSQPRAIMRPSGPRQKISTRTGCSAARICATFHARNDQNAATRNGFCASTSAGARLRLCQGRRNKPCKKARVPPGC